MNLDSLFTVFALLVAVYAILPSAKRRSIVFYSGGMYELIFFLSSLIIIGLHFIYLFYEQKYFMLFGRTLTPYYLSFLVFVVAIIVIRLIYPLRINILAPSRIEKYDKLIEELYKEEKYLDILLLVNVNINWIEKVYNKEFREFKIHKHLAQKLILPPELLNEITKDKNDNTNPSFKKKIKLYLSRHFSNAKLYLSQHFSNAKLWLSRYFSSGDTESEVANRIINLIHTDKNLIKVMASNRHDIAVSILGKQFHGGENLADIYLRYLIENKDSILYSETWEGKHNNKILNFLFNDCEIAIRLEVWRPIGEYVIEQLDKFYLCKGMSTNVYNHSTRFYENDAGNKFVKESPLFAGVDFFDKMVHSALKQGIKHPMWLWYFHDFVVNILRNLSPDKDVNMKDEFPTHYHHLLFNIASSLSSWIQVVESKIPPSQENIKIDNEYPSRKGNIMENVIFTLGEVVHQIMTCDERKIGKKFKFCIMRMVYNRYFALVKNDRTQIYAEALINSIRRDNGDSKYRENRTSLKYKEILLEVANDDETIDFFMNIVHAPKLRKILQNDINKHDE